MDGVYENYENLLAEFAREAGAKLEREKNSLSATLQVGDDGSLIVNLELLPESGKLLAWAAVGRLGDDENAAARAAYLLSVNDTSFIESGFVTALDSRNGEVIAHDIRDLGWFDGADRLAAWIEALVELVRGVRIQCDERYPFVDDETFEPLIEEVK